MTRVVHLLGNPTYAEVHALQRALVDARAREEVPDTILLLEHAETITVGRSRGAASNVVQPGSVPIVEVERGGDVTWHGPGQLVAYPIIALTGTRRDLHAHLHALEDAVIALLADLGLPAGRDARNTGVWLPHAGGARKVCSVGIACRRWVTWHGLALNAAPDLSAFARIRPCGFSPDVMTRLADHLQPTPTAADLAAPLAGHLCAALGVPFDGDVPRAATGRLWPSGPPG